MLRNISGLRWSCEVCRVLPRTLSSRSCSNGTPSSGPPDQFSNTEAEKGEKSKGQMKGKNIATKEEVRSKLSGLLASLKVQGRIGDGNKKELELASYTLRQTRRPAPLPAPKQALKQKFQTLGSKMAKAVESVAEELGGGEETQKELLESLERIRSDKTTPSSPPGSSPEPQQHSPEAASKLKSTLSSLSVEKQQSRHASRRLLDTSSGLGLLEAEPLNIFPPVDDTAVPPPSAPLLPTWEAQAARDLRLLTARPVDSPFQELIQWTEQGKIWQFPINNEFGMDEEEESKVGFQDHIFLERHLSPWCPTRGPIAHFMELVCVGLSKNPYVTVQRKKETIFWYRDYFESKKNLLKEIGAIEKETASEEQKQT